MKVKEESEKAGLKLNIQKTKIIASSLITANMWGNNGNSERLDILGLQYHYRCWLQPWNWKMLAPWKKSHDNLDGIEKQRDHFAGKGLSS